jgi:hypothetical protein
VKLNRTAYRLILIPRKRSRSNLYRT